jgi:hypothetical protein
MGDYSTSSPTPRLARRICIYVNGRAKERGGGGHNNCLKERSSKVSKMAIFAWLKGRDDKPLNYLEQSLELMKTSLFALVSTLKGI